jgi:hypothetical protein
MRAFSKLAAATVAAGLGVALLGAPAFAAGVSTPQVVIGGGSPACTDGNGSDCMYYSANGTGARVEVFGNVACYDNCGTQQYVFSDKTKGTAGYADIVRNATHYVYNNNTSSTLSIYVSPNYGGADDWFNYDGGDAPYYTYPTEGWYRNLYNTLNNNASQAWGTAN